MRGRGHRRDSLCESGMQGPSHADRLPDDARLERGT